MQPVGERIRLRAVGGTALAPPAVGGAGCLAVKPERGAARPTGLGGRTPCCRGVIRGANLRSVVRLWVSGGIDDVTIDAEASGNASCFPWQSKGQGFESPQLHRVTCGNTCQVDLISCLGDPLFRTTTGTTGCLVDVQERPPLAPADVAVLPCQGRVLASSACVVSAWLAAASGSADGSRVTLWGWRGPGRVEAAGRAAAGRPCSGRAC